MTELHQGDPGVDFDGLGDLGPRRIVLAQVVVGECPPEVGMGGKCGAGLAFQEFLEGNKRLVGLLGIEVGEAHFLEKPSGIIGAEAHRRLELPNGLLRPAGVVEKHGQ